jgi:alpha-methylacyl-CoA racemase
MALAAGHDINYISLSGALHAIGPKDTNPTPPLNLVGDFGGGGMLLAFGIASALVETAATGKGQVVDAAMTDGSALLMNAIFGIMNAGNWTHDRSTNLLDGGAHFYGTYETKDGRYISIGSMEPQFYALLLEKVGLSNDQDFAKQMSREDWPALRSRLEAVFLEKTRDEWDEIMLGSDVCYAPILKFEEAASNPHNQERQTFVESSGITQAAPAPRFSRTPAELPTPAVAPGKNTDEVLSSMGLNADEIAALKSSGAVA